MYYPFYYPYGYRTSELPGGLYTNLEIYTYPENVQTALELIADAVSKEMEDDQFYNYLLSIAPDQEALNIITGIRNDELRHYKMDRTIYYQLTGQLLPEAPGASFTKPDSYCDGLKQAIQGELAAVVRYRKILFAMQNRIHINMVTEIMTDELRHANLYNLLISLNNCFSRS